MKKTGLLALALLLTGATLAMAVGPNAPCGATRIEGTISAIDAGTQQILVAGVTVQVTPDTVIKMGSKAIAFADLKVGMTVAACGVVDEDGVLVASTVNVKYQGK
jgi:hypothetical protein